jgi:hypothetical protein
MTLARQLIEQHLAGSSSRLVLDNALCEVNLKTLKKQNPAASIFIDKLVDAGVSNKYLQWAVVHFNRAKKERHLGDRPFSPGDNSDDVQRAADYFEILAKRFERIQQQKKLDNAIKVGLYERGAADINYWNKKDLEDFAAMLAHVEQLKSRKEIKVSGSDVIYRDDRFTVYRPITHDASKQIGAGTRWCISGSSSNYFDSYTSQGKIFAMIMDRYASPENDYNKVAVVVDLNDKSRSDWEYFNAPDRSVKSSDVIEALGKDEWTKIAAAIEKYADKQEIPIPEREPGDIWAGDRVENTESRVYSEVDWWKERWGGREKAYYLSLNKERLGKILKLLADVVEEILQGATGTVLSPTRTKADDYDMELDVEWEMGSLPYSWDETVEEIHELVPLPPEPINPLKQKQLLLPLPGQARELADKYTAEYAAYKDAQSARDEVNQMINDVETTAERSYRDVVYAADIEVTWRNDPADAIRDYGPID